MAKVKDIDKGWKRITKDMREINNKKVNIGVLANSGLASSGTSLVLIASANEFGANIPVTDKTKGWFWGQGAHINKPFIKIPARPFMRQTFDQNYSGPVMSKIFQLRADVIQGVKTVRTALEELGVYYKGLIQRQFRKGNFTPNSELTKKLKKSSQPLINTGRLRQSIDFEVK